MKFYTQSGICWALVLVLLFQLMVYDLGLHMVLITEFRVFKGSWYARGKTAFLCCGWQIWKCLVKCDIEILVFDNWLFITFCRLLLALAHQYVWAVARCFYFYHIIKNLLICFVNLLLSLDLLFLFFLFLLLDKAARPHSLLSLLCFFLFILKFVKHLNLLFYFYLDFNKKLLLLFLNIV